jgi:hypothetical protein
MAELLELSSITDQKRLLRAQCELCRRSLQLELGSLRDGTAWVRRGVETASRYRSLLWVAAPVVGFLIARRGRQARRLLVRGVTAWQLLSRLWRWTSAIRRAR